MRFTVVVANGFGSRSCEDRQAALTMAMTPQQSCQEYEKRLTSQTACIVMV